MKITIFFLLGISQYLCLSLSDLRIFKNNMLEWLPDEEVKNEKVTYPGIGTFTNKDFYDSKYRPFVYLPQSPKEINTVFLLHTRNNLQYHQVLKINDVDSIKNSYFNASNPTKFIVHGFEENQLIEDWMNKTAHELLIAGDYNVVIVDWSGGNGSPYGQAVANTRVVGKLIALLVEDLKNATGISMSSVHIIGNSLGSHVAGYSSKNFEVVGRITALDPAGPYFEGIPPEGRLDPTDAEFVDVIHTDGEDLLGHYSIGTLEIWGHIDFYPNGGKNQPGCDKKNYTQILNDGFRKGVVYAFFCNHQLSNEFYMSSINNKRIQPIAYQCYDFESFKAGKCTDCGTNGEKCALLGENADSWTKFKSINSGKKFFLKTGKHYPYFKYEYVIRIKFSPKYNRTDQSAIIWVTLHGDKYKDKFQLNNEYKIYHLGRTYSFLVISDYEFRNTSKLTFRWESLLGFMFNSKMFINSITVVPLTSPNFMDKEKHLSEIKTFCTKNSSKGIDNDINVDFSVVC